MMMDLPLLHPPYNLVSRSASGGRKWIYSVRALLQHIFCSSWDRSWDDSEDDDEGYERAVKKLPKNPADTWVVLSQDPYKTERISIYSLWEKNVYTLRLSKFLRGWWCCGISKGCFLMANPGKDSIPAMLWIPSARSGIRLPPLSTIPCLNRLKEEEDGYQKLDICSLSHRVEVFSAGHHLRESAIVAISVGGRDESKDFAFCRSLDEK